MNPQQEAITLCSTGIDSVEYGDENVGRTRFSSFEALRHEEKLCDVILKVKGQSFPVHSLVLAASSPYFYAALTNHTMENCLKELEKVDIEPLELKALIDYAYNGKLYINDGNVNGLITGAGFFQLTQVFDFCLTFFKKRFSFQNVLGYRRVGESLGCLELIKAADRYINRYFVQVVLEAEFLQLEPDELISLIRRDELNLLNEEIVFECCLKWLRFDQERRKQFFPRVLSQVRLGLLKPHYLINVVAAVDVIRSSLECRDLLDEARNYRLISDRALESFRTMKRTGLEVDGEMYIVGFREAHRPPIKSIVQIFDFKTSQFRSLGQMSRTKCARVAFVNSKFYAFGICSGTKYLSNTEVYDLKECRWMPQLSKVCGRTNAGVTVIDGQVYICGGFNGVPLNTVECYCPSKNTSYFVPPMNETRSPCVLATIGRYIYAMGGSRLCTSLERYDVQQKIWVKLQPMQQRRREFGFAAVNGYLYACGGTDGRNVVGVVERYDPDFDKWKFVAPMQVDRSHFALIANKGCLWAVGGRADYRNISNLEMYDPDKDEWTKMSSTNYSAVSGISGGVLTY